MPYRFDPSRLLKEVFHVEGRNVLDIVNKSLVSRVAPSISSFKCGGVAFSKKPNLDPDSSSY